MENTEYRDDRAVTEIFSKTIRAGKRTYFFDVKSTRNNEYYLTITESKKKFLDEGNFRYEKHKLFLYPEDFHKFSESLNEVLEFINENQPDQSSAGGQGPEDNLKEITDIQSITDEKFSGIDFEDI